MEKLPRDILLKESIWRIACRRGNTITLHPDLKKKRWQGLRQTILKHELEHINGAYVADDFFVDMDDRTKSYKNMELWFLIFHPTTWINYFSPLIIEDNRLKIKPLHAVEWCIILGALISGWIMF